jgi:hypothetical protein
MIDKILENREYIILYIAWILISLRLIEALINFYIRKRGNKVDV